MDFLQLIKDHDLAGYMLAGHFGLEKENLRTVGKGHMALTPHPTIFGDKASNPFITTDFAEAQIEMVTPALESPAQAFQFMQTLHDIVSLTLKDEYLWPYSLPPILPQDDNLIKAAYFTQPEITQYREYLARKYGKRKQLLSGIHYNFSFSQKLMGEIYNATDKKLSYREFHDEVYLKVARVYLKYAWLIIYLFGANSVAHESYMTCCKRSQEKITNDTYDFHGSSSFRNGVSGYRNLNHFFVSYNSLSHYISDIEKAITDGNIIAAKEYYSQIRLKGHSKGSILEDLSKDGINYIEIRTLDLNPLVPLGVTLEQLEFVHLMLVYCLIAPDFRLCDEDYRFANLNQLLAADANREEDIMLHFGSHQQKDLRLWGGEFIQAMIDVFTELNIATDKLSLLRNTRDKLLHDKSSIASEIKEGVIRRGYANFFMQKSIDYLALSKHDLPGFNLATYPKDGEEYANEIVATLVQ